MSKIEEIVSLFGETLETIRRYQACDFYEDKEGDCSCAGCQAKWALEKVGYDWRSKIAMDQLGMDEVTPLPSHLSAGPYPERLNWHARERRLVGAFLGDTAHRYFGHIVGQKEPTLRDWRAAIGVVRWLGTNVGSFVLEVAGWRYGRYQEDREQESSRERALERWTQGLGWLLSITDSPTKDEELHRLARIARDAIQDVINYLNMRSERETTWQSNP